MDGYFVGDFFGVEHDWNIVNSEKSFFLKEEIEELFKNFEVLDDIKNYRKKEKGIQWHRYEVIARKNE